MKPVLPCSVVIGTRDRSSLLRDALASILTGTHVPAEIVVVDQSGGPEAADRGEPPPAGCEVRWLRSAAPGLSRANNLGAAAARHDLLLFTHDDVLVGREWLSTLVRVLNEDGPATVVTGRILAGAAETADGFAPTLRVSTEPAVYEGRIEYDVLKPLNLGMHRAAFACVGGFDVRLGPGTAFPGAEDSDLGFRLLAAGCRIRYVPDALVVHRAWRRGSDYLPLRWKYGMAQGAFYAKHAVRQPRHIAQRIRSDVRHRALHFRGRLQREGSRAWGDPLFVLGYGAGALRWWLGGHGRRPASEEA